VFSIMTRFDLSNWARIMLTTSA